MPNVYSDTLTHDAILVWLQPPARDVVGGVSMRTAPPPVVGDDIVVGELARVQVGLALVVFDDAPGADGMITSTGLPVLAVDAAAPTEAVEGRVGVLLPAVSDVLAPGEAVTLTLPLPGVAVVDSLVPDDAVALRSGLVVVDDLVPTDAATVQMPLQVVAVEAGTPTEVVAPALNALFPSVVDTVTVTEVATRLQPITLVVEDTTAVDERRNASMARPKKIKIRGPGVR
jgi:hypothetical protein